MKTIIYCVVTIAIVLVVCFNISLIRSKATKREMRWTNLITPLIALQLFIGLFVGGSISRSNIRKELAEMIENNEKRGDYSSRLTAIEERNNDISWIIGRDRGIEKKIKDLKEVP